MTIIRPFHDSDVPLGLELCRIAGWNQVEADWRRLMRLQHDGVFVAEDGGRACGTASAICYGDRIGWIGMILVHPEFRGKGIGSLLMRACIDFLRGRKVKAIKLDATDDGRPVYVKLGFVDERPIWRFAGEAKVGGRSSDGLQAADRGSGDLQTRIITAELWPAIASMDRAAFDGERLDLLQTLASEGPAVAAMRGGQLQAFGFARPGHLAWHLGPVVGSAAGATAVIERLMGGIPAGKVFWDILPDNAVACQMAQSMGFTPIRKLTRMFLGEDMLAGRVQEVFAGAGFELG